MDFAALPPEVNSGLMYAGPGSSPMLAAAASWDNLAIELASAAGDYGSIVANLTAVWRGPASASMAAAAAPYVAWLGQAAAQAKQTAGQAKSAAGAYETAFAMTVPPSVVAANRALHASLIATNLLGQNTPAIAATEAHYAQMWAQDAAAMYGYAGTSAAASTLAPFTGPPPVSAGAVAQATDLQTTLSQLLSAVPTALQGLTSPLSSTSSTSGLSGIMNWLGLGGANLSTPAGILNFLAGKDGSPLGAFLNNNGLNTIFSSGFYMPGNWLGTMMDLAGLAGSTEAATEAAGDALGAAAAGGFGEAGAGLGGLGGVGGLSAASGLGGVAAGLGRAGSIGSLSVPPSWTTLPPIASGAAGLPGMSGAVPEFGAAPSMLGGMPLASPPVTGHGIVGDTPRYGFRPTVMAHPPAAG